VTSDKLGEIFTYPSLSVSVDGFSRQLILKASPCFGASRLPWYDFVLVNVEERGYSARLLAIVSISLPVEGAAEVQERLLAFIEYYVSAVPPTQAVLLEEDGQPRKAASQGIRGDDLRFRSPKTLLPLVQSERKYVLIETQAIEGGLWAQPMFSHPEKFWVLCCHDVV